MIVLKKELEVGFKILLIPLGEYANKDFAKTEGIITKIIDEASYGSKKSITVSVKVTKVAKQATLFSSLGDVVSVTMDQKYWGYKVLETNDWDL